MEEYCYYDPTEVEVDQSCIVTDSDGTVHYYDEDGIEEYTFTPGWG